MVSAHDINRYANGLMQCGREAARRGAPTRDQSSEPV
jgi:hypothetical protein